MSSPLWPRRGLWRHGDFLKLWAGQTISQFGSQVSQLGIPLVAILALDASAFEVASLATVEFMPFLLFTLPAGVWVDRLPPRALLIAGDVGRAVLLFSIPVAYATDVLTLAQLYVVGFLIGICTVFFDVAYQSYLPALVERDQLVEGNSKLEMTRSAAQIAGPGAAGGLIGLITAPYAIVLDAVSFVVSGGFLAAIRRTEPARAPSADGAKPRMRTELLEGLRYVLGHRYLLPQAICTATSNFFSNVAFSIFLVYAVRRLDLTAEVIGLVFALGNVGTIAGAVFAARLSRRFGVGPTTLAMTFVWGPAMLLVPLAPAGFPEPVLVVSGVVIGFAVVVYNITQVSLRQAITPMRLQGRMNAVMRFIVWGTIPLGSLVGGALASAIGLRETLFVGAIGASFTFLPILLSPVRSIREMPEPVEEPTPTEAAREGGVVTPTPAPATPDA